MHKVSRGLPVIEGDPLLNPLIVQSMEGALCLWSRPERELLVIGESVRQRPVQPTVFGLLADGSSIGALSLCSGCLLSAALTLAPRTARRTDHGSIGSFEDLSTASTDAVDGVHKDLFIGDLSAARFT